jgi:TP901 family phage tail tape measure protein
MAVNVGTIVATLRLQSQQFTAGMKQAAATAEKAGKRLGDVGKRAQGVGKSLSMGVTLPLVGASLAAIKFSQDMNAGMANVASLIPGSTERVKELKTTVQDLAVATGISTTDMADGLYNVISALGDTADTEKILEINARAAAAGLSTVTDAINLTSGVTKGYGDISAAATQKASDLAFTTVKLGQTTFPELAGALGRVVPIAAKLNLSQEELFATFATLTGVTGKTSMVSTQFAAVLTGLMKPTTGMSKAVEKLGFAGSESMLQTLGFKETLDALIGTTDGSAEAVGKLFGSQEALVGIFALTGEQAGIYDEKLKAMGASVGATDEAFKEQTEGINASGFAWKQLKIELTVVAQQIGDELQPVFTTVVSALKDDLIPAVKEWIAWFNELSPSIKNVVLGVLAVTVALPPLLVLLGTIGIVIGGLSLPIIAVAAGIGLVIAAFVLWGDSISSWVSGVFSDFMESLEWWQVKLGIITKAEAATAKAHRQLVVDTKALTVATEEAREALGEAGATGSVLELHEAMKDLGDVVGGLNEDEMKKIANRAMKLRMEGKKLTPELESVADHMFNMSVRASEAAQEQAGLAREEERVTRKTKELSTATQEFNQRIAEQVTAWRQGGIPAGRDAMAAYEAFGGSLSKLSEGALKKFNTDVGEMIKHMIRTGEEVPAEAFNAWSESLDLLNPKMLELSDVLEDMPTLPPEFLEIPTMPLDQALSGFEKLNAEALTGKSTFGQWGDSVKGGFTDLWTGMTGGSGKISGLFSSLGTGIMDGFGSIISGGLSSLISMGVGLAMKGLGKLAGWVKGLFGGPDEAEKAARELVKVFEDTIIAGLDQAQLAEAGGRRWAQVVIGVRDAYLNAGYSIDEAEAIVQRLWDAIKEGPEATQAIIDSIQHVIDLSDEIDQLTQDTIDGLISLAEEGARTGELLPQHLEPYLATLLEAGEITEGNMRALMLMAEQAQYDWRDVQAAAERYGIEVDLLGKKFQAAKWGEKAAQVAADWELMNVQGARGNRIARRMAETVQGLIDDYVAAGIAIPESMRPIIERQIEMGLLTDENGDAITDISQLDFAAPLVSQFDRLILAIQELVNSLIGADGVTEAIETVNDTEINDRTMTVQVKYNDPGYDPTNSSGQGYQGGTHGKFIDFGQGTPAILHGRERIMTEVEGAREATSEIGGLEVLDKRLVSIERLLRDQPRAFGLAVSDSLTLMN